MSGCGWKERDGGGRSFREDGGWGVEETVRTRIDVERRYRRREAVWREVEM